MRDFQIRPRFTLRRMNFDRTEAPETEIAMTTLARWNPFRELDTIQNRLTTLFGVPFGRAFENEALTEAEWAPRADIEETEKEYLVKVELPEMKRDDVHVTVENGVLRITGERKFEKEENGKKYHRVERAYGTFERDFMLPENAKADMVTADYKDGLLKVHMPKTEKATPKPVEVKVN